LASTTRTREGALPRGQGRDDHAQDVCRRDRRRLPAARHAASRSYQFRYLRARAGLCRARFGEVGAYERITAKATIALDPADDRNAVIADLAAAPRNADGKVEATADVVILQPADAARGNGTLLLDVLNRGRKLAPQLFDDSAQPGAKNAQGPEDAGIKGGGGQGSSNEATSIEAFAELVKHLA
jgi:hypothetical protein